MLTLYFAVLCCNASLCGADMCDVLGGGDVTFHTTHAPDEVFKVVWEENMGDTQEEHL